MLNNVEHILVHKPDKFLAVPLYPNNLTLRDLDSIWSFNLPGSKLGMKGLHGFMAEGLHFTQNEACHMLGPNCLDLSLEADIIFLEHDGSSRIPLDYLSELRTIACLLANHEIKPEQEEIFTFHDRIGESIFTSQNLG